MTLRKWLSTVGSCLTQHNIKSMADELSVDYIYSDNSPYTISELSREDRQLDAKSSLVVNMFMVEFGLDMEF